MQTYGAPHIHAELAAADLRCGKKRVARRMRTAGNVGCHRRRHVVTTDREDHASPAPDYLLRQFVAAAPNLRWTADITESFFATLDCELLDRSTFQTRTQARIAIFDYIEGFYNTHRRQNLIDMADNTCYHPVKHTWCSAEPGE